MTIGLIGILEVPWVLMVTFKAIMEVLGK